MKSVIHETQPNNWNKLYGTALSETEYRAICTNLNNFFVILKGWNKENDKTIAN